MPVRGRQVARRPCAATPGVWSGEARAGGRCAVGSKSALRMLCQAIRLDVDARDFRCEQRLVEEAHRINNAGEMLAPVIHDAHLIGVHDRLQRN